MTQTQTLPHWQLDSIFPSLDSPEYANAKAEVKNKVEALEHFMDEHGVRELANPRVDTTTATVLDELIAQSNDLYAQYLTVRTYLIGFTATDAFNDRAQAETSAFAPLGSKLSVLSKRLTAWVGSFDPNALIKASDLAKDYTHFIKQSKLEARHLMGDEAEELVSALGPSSGGAWGKLHGDLISRDTIIKALPGRERAEYPLTELKNLQSESNQELRKAAFEAELELLERNTVPYAAAMNAIKGHVNEVSERRGWASALDAALFQNAISRESLAAMQEACEEHFPTFRRYLKAKAKFLGQDSLAWYDLLAPVSVGEPRSYTWDEAKAFVRENFGRYSDELATFAQKTFDKGWLDVPPRKGKRNGAFCMSIFGVKESRVMLNFGGQLDDIFTVAHELGHAYHNQQFYTFERTFLQNNTPMTLAETASIFCETIVTNAMLNEADEAQTLAILEQDLLGATQLVVDIHSRFVFEQTVFEKRKERELSIDEFKGIMLNAQAETYGDALTENARHPLMWAQKGHYYSTGRSFYNFPYTFGYLFGLGLYAQYRDEPEGWHERYNELLASTGMDDAAPLAKSFGIDIEDANFWRESLEIAAERVEQYEALVDKYAR